MIANENSWRVKAGNSHKQKISGKIKEASRVGEIFRGSGNFEPKKQEESNRKEKGAHHIIGSLFSPLPDVTVLMLLTDFPQGTALNHCRWCGIEYNRCGRHVLDH